MLLTIVSFLIVLGETTILFTPDKEDTVINSFLRRGNSLEWNITILIPLAYFVSVNIYGLFKLKILDLYRLQPNRQTDAYSLIFFSTFILRFIPILAWNFLNIAGIKNNT